MCLPGYIWLFMFSIVPMVGIVMAFQNFNPSKGWFGSPWVGFENFEFLWTIPDAKRALWNTLVIAVSKVILNIIVPMTFALLLNEIKNMKFKKGVQTIVYLPHFISWVLLGNIITNMLGTKGILNYILGLFGAGPVMPMTEPSTFQGLLVGTDIWKEFGYGTIVYLAAICGIEENLYEAAMVDGAGAWRQLVHVTLPGLVPTIVLMTVLSLGNVLNAGFDQVYNLYSKQVYSTGDIIDTFIYRLGLIQQQFGQSTAMGMFKSVVSTFFISVSYFCAYKFADYRIF